MVEGARTQNGLDPLQPPDNPGGVNVCALHSGVVAMLDMFATSLKRGYERMDRIEISLTDIREKLLGRPSWAVTLMMSCAVGAVTGLLGVVAALAWRVATGIPSPGG